MTHSLISFFLNVQISLSRPPVISLTYQNARKQTNAIMEIHLKSVPSASWTTLIINRPASSLSELSSTKDILRYSVLRLSHVVLMIADSRICRVWNAGGELLTARYYQDGTSPYETYAWNSHVRFHRPGADRAEILFWSSFVSSRLCLSDSLAIAALHHDNRDFAILPNYQPKGCKTLEQQTSLFGKSQGVIMFFSYAEYHW